MFEKIIERSVSRFIIDSLLSKQDAPPLGLTHNKLRSVLYRIIGGVDGTVSGIVGLIASKNAALEDKAHLMSVGDGLNHITDILKKMDIGDSLKRLSTSGGILKNIVRNMTRYSDFLKSMSNEREYATMLDRSLLRKLSGDIRNESALVSTLIV